MPLTRDEAERLRAVFDSLVEGDVVEVEDVGDEAARIAAELAASEAVEAVVDALEVAGSDDAELVAGAIDPELGGDTIAEAAIDAATEAVEAADDAQEASDRGDFSAAIDAAGRAAGAADTAERLAEHVGGEDSGPTDDVAPAPAFVDEDGAPDQSPGGVHPWFRPFSTWRRR